MVTITIFISIILGILVFCITYIICFKIFKDKITINSRINKLTNKQIEQNVKPNQKKIQTNIIHDRRIARQLELAGILLRPEEYLLMWAGVTIIPSTFLILLGANILSAFVVCIIGFIIFPLMLSRAKKKRMVKFEKQLGESLTIMSNCLKAGFTLRQSMQSIANDMPDPISMEFSKTLREIRLGISLDVAMGNMVRRINNYDLGLLVSAVLIQQKAGGNLADVLDNISDTIKNRIKIKSEIRILTASGRISGIIIGLLPLFLLGALMLLNPDYMVSFFSNPISILLLGLALIFEIIGFIIIKKIVDIKV